jgi:hypothetical protein
MNSEKRDYNHALNPLRNSIFGWSNFNPQEAERAAKMTILSMSLVSWKESASITMFVFICTSSPTAETLLYDALLEENGNAVTKYVDSMMYYGSLHKGNITSISKY